MFRDIIEHNIIGVPEATEHVENGSLIVEWPRSADLDATDVFLGWYLPDVVITTLVDFAIMVNRFEAGTVSPVA